MKKFNFKLLIVVFFLLTGSSAFSYSGFMANQKNLKTYSTKWFEIIYCEDSAKTASIIAKDADSIFEELLNNFGVMPKSNWKTPVVISPSTEIFNAYMTSILFNHLVIYDSIPDEDSAFSADAILDTFRHELTHSVSIFFTANKAGNYPLDLTMSLIFTAPTFIKEGATVFEESQKGSGRLNNEFYLHMAKQAKLENKFPSWSDVFGARDIYPSGSACYGFGGVFADYLVRTYGRGKYNQLWKTMNNSGSITLHGSFKKVYGKPIATVWEEFYNWVEVPEVAKLNGEEILNSNNTDLFHYNCGAANHFATYNSASDYVMLDGQKFTRMDNVSGLSISEDGKLLAVSYYDLNSQNIKTKIKVYDIATKKVFGKQITESCLRDGTIISVDGKNYLAAIKSYSQQQKIVLFDLSTGNLVKEFLLNQYIYSLTNAGYGQLAFLTKENDSWKTCLTTGNIFADSSSEFSFIEFDVGKKYKNFKMQNLMLTGLRKEGDTIERSFAFSYGAQKKFPRLGFVDIEGFENYYQSEYRLMDQELSGAVYDPACWKGKIIYSAHNFENIPLRTIDISKYSFTKVDGIQTAKEFESQNIGYKLVENELVPQSESESEREFKFNSKPYKHMYYNDGIFLPVSIVPQFGFDSTEYEFLLYNVEQTEYIFFPGVTWVTSTPWDSDFLIATMGYDFFTNSFGLQTNFFNKSNTGIFNYNVSPTVVFDDKGIKQVTNSAEISSSISIDNKATISFSDSAFLFYGRPQYLPESVLQERMQKLSTSESFSDYVGYMSTIWTKDIFSVSNVAGITVSNVHKNNSRRNSYEGFASSVKLTTNSGWNLSDTTMNDVYCNLGWSVAGCVAFPLPINISAKFYPSKTLMLSGSAEALLFDMEIQKSITWLPLYFNHWGITLNYDAAVYNENSNWQFLKIAEDFNSIGSKNIIDYVSFNVNLKASLNWGTFTGGSGLGVGVMYLFHGVEPGKSPIGVNICSSLYF